MPSPRRVAVLTIGCAFIVGIAAGPVFGQERGPATSSTQNCGSTPCETHDAKRYATTGESPRNFFLRSLLIDAFWVPTDSGNRSIGLIGAHLAVANIGRLYIYGPPGVMVLRGQSEFQTAYTWGFSFYVTDFTVPGFGRRAVLYVNLAKCWTQGDERTGNNIAGLSVAWKR